MELKKAALFLIIPIFGSKKKLSRAPIRALIFKKCNPIDVDVKSGCPHYEIKLRFSVRSWIIEIEYARFRLSQEADRYPS